MVGQVKQSHRGGLGGVTVGVVFRSAQAVEGIQRGEAEKDRLISFLDEISTARKARINCSVLMLNEGQFKAHMVYKEFKTTEEACALWHIACTAPGIHREV